MKKKLINGIMIQSENLEQAMKDLKEVRNKLEKVVEGYDLQGLHWNHANEFLERLNGFISYNDNKKRFKNYANI